LKRPRPVLGGAAAATRAAARAATGAAAWATTWAIGAGCAYAAADAPWADEAAAAQVQARIGLPRPLALAASWDRELIEQAYASLGAQLAALHKQAVLAPALDVLRDVRRGDASASFGEDPYLTGELGAAAVLGLQAPRAGRAQIAAVVGHFAGPQLPPPGSDLGPMPVSPRELREVFAAPFEAVLSRAHPAGVLLSDNEIDGLPSQANPALVQMLKQDWHYAGAVLASPRGLRGLVDVYHLAATPTQALALAQQAGADGVAGEAKAPVAEAATGTAFSAAGSTGVSAAVSTAVLAQRAARESIVLLKNDGTLPLTANAKTAVLRVADATAATLAHVDVPTGTFVLVLSGRIPPPSPALTDLVSRASAVLAGFELGTQGRAALDDALAGRINPGGKLPLSLARNAGQLPMFYSVKPSAGRGYLFDTTQPLFPFGWGLSYTHFELGAPQLAAATVRVGEPAQVSVEVRNSGARTGAQVVQLYLRHRASSTTQPVKQLVGFARVTLAPGEHQTLRFDVAPAQRLLCNEAMHRVEEPGDYELMSGANSAELQSTTLKVLSP